MVRDELCVFMERNHSIGVHGAPPPRSSPPGLCNVKFNFLFQFPDLNGSQSSCKVLLPWAASARQTMTAGNAKDAKKAVAGLTPQSRQSVIFVVSQDFDFLQSIAVKGLAAPLVPHILAAKGPVAVLCLAGRTAVKVPPAPSSPKRCRHRRQREHSMLPSNPI